MNKIVEQTIYNCTCTNTTVTLLSEFFLKKVNTSLINVLI